MVPDVDGLLSSESIVIVYGDLCWSEKLISSLGLECGGLSVDGSSGLLMVLGLLLGDGVDCKIILCLLFVRR